VRRQSGAATALWVLTDGTLSVVKINLIRLGGLAAVLAGILRLLSSVLPTTSPRIMALYLVIDILLLISSIGLFEFQRLEAGIPEKLALESQNIAALGPVPANPFDGDWPDRVLLSTSVHLISRIRNSLWDWICDRRHRDLFASPSSMSPNSS
jgi:hypothetical protein